MEFGIVGLDTTFKAIHPLSAIFNSTNPANGDVPPVVFPISCCHAFPSFMSGSNWERIGTVTVQFCDHLVERVSYIREPIFGMLECKVHFVAAWATIRLDIEY